MISPVPTFGFSPSLDEQLATGIERIINTRARPWVAAFDADGTLWDMDMGETFFQFQIDACALKTLPSDPWKHYEDLKKIDHRQAYLWLAQINQGQRLSQVQAWAAQSVERAQPVPVFTPQAALIRYLKQKKFEVYIVTASVRWAVAAAAHLVGVEPEHVLGIQTAIEDGIVTDKPFGPITWREGKAEALRQVTSDKGIHFGVGNTLGDAALLEAASDVRLAVFARRLIDGIGSESPERLAELRDSEQRLQNLANERGWLRHGF